MQTTDCATIIAALRRMGKPENLAVMAHFGINPENAFGVSMPELRRMAKNIGINHSLALQLWDSGNHEAEILSSLIADPALTNRDVVIKWASDFNSWGVCDQTCANLFAKTVIARDLATELTENDAEFVRRAGFAIMAVLAVYDKNAPDRVFEEYLNLIERHSRDARNFVRKAVNWALRNIGKKNMALHAKALRTAGKLAAASDKTARWIGKDAIRELRKAVIIERIRLKTENEKN